MNKTWHKDFPPRSIAERVLMEEFLMMEEFLWATQPTQPTQPMLHPGPPAVLGAGAALPLSPSRWHEPALRVLRFACALSVAGHPRTW